MDLELADASVFVAAASKGLGKGAATRFAAEGANVAIGSRDSGNLEAARSEILAATDREDGAVTTVEMDLTDRASIQDGVTSVVDSLGGLDVLVTNHGGPSNESFEATSLSNFDEGYDAVLGSTLTLCKASLPGLRDGGGAVTHIVAASSAEPTPHGAIGNVFRPGIYGLSKTLANEEGEHGVRSNCVAPRGVRTDRIESKIAERAAREGLSEAAVRELRVEELPLSDMGTPATFGKAVAFISSPAAEYTTGSILRVDGGWSRSLR